MVRKKLIPVLLAAVLLFGGVSAGDRSVEKTITDYLKLLVESSISEEKISLKDFQEKFSGVADKEISRKLYFWIQSWHDSGLYMDAKLDRIEFVEEKIEGNKATVITEEFWTYKYIDKRKNRTALPDTKIIYKVKYTLEKRNGNWIITGIKVLSEKKITK